MAKESIKWGAADTPVEAIRWGEADQPAEMPAAQPRQAEAPQPAPEAVDAAGMDKPFVGYGNAFAKPVAVPKLDHSPLQNEAEQLRDEFFTGVDNTRAALKTVNVAAQSAQLQRVQDQLSRLESSGQGDSPQAQGLRKTIEHYGARLPKMIGGMTEAQADAQRGAQMTTRPAVAELNNAKTFGEAWEVFKQNPYDVIAGVSATSLPTMLPALVTGAVMGPAAGAVTMGGSSAVTEAGSSLADFAQNAGVDTTNPQAVEAFFSDRKNLADAMSYAGKRAGIIGTLDAVSGGVAGKTLAPRVLKNQLARQAVNMPAQMAVQAGLGAGGEAGGQLATKGRIDQPGQVLAEAAGELAGAPSEVVAFSKDARAAILGKTSEDSRVKRLRDAGETAAADLLQRRMDRQSADTELSSLQLPAAQTPEFQDTYRGLRASGVKPAEAAARTAVVTDFRSAASSAGMSEKAISAALDAGQKKGLDELPGFLHRFTQSLAAKGAAQPVDIGAQLEAARDAGLDAATESLYADVQQNMEDVRALEEQQSKPAEAVDNIERLLTPAAEPQAAAPAFETGNDIQITPESDAAHAAATSPLNDLPEPTQAQKDAGNYKVGRLRIAGMDISIENPQGSTRSGTDQDGNAWTSPMRHHYGYFRQTTANDGDKLDVFVVPGTPEDYRGPVFVVDQVDPKTGKLDEHKVVLGAQNEAEAEQIYRSNYSADWQGLGAITRLPLPAFKAWAANGNKKEALGDIQTPPQQTPEARQAAAPLPADQAAAASDGPAGLQPGAVQPAGETAGRGPADQPAAVEPAARSAPESAETVDRRQEPRGADRRTATDLRKRVAEMSEAELRDALLTDHLTGLKNRRAYDESTKLPTQVSIDADSLKWVNDNLGHDSGDQLLKAIGQAIGEETQEAYHVSGDEFVVQAHTEAEARSIMERARLRMSQARIEATDAQGKDIVLTGVGVSYGIAGDLNEAERFLGRDKAQRESQGLRAARGEVPPNAAVSVRGEENQARGAAAEEVKKTPADAGVSVSAAKEVTQPAKPEPQIQATAEKPISQLSAADLLRAAAEKMEERPEKPAAKPAERLTASWVIREKDTGKVIMETFDKKKVDALNTKKYEAVQIQEHLASLSKKPPKEEPQEPMFSRTSATAERDLIIQHNVTPANLVHADRMGGMAAPSVAITKVGQPLHGFGEITLIGDKNLADPKKGLKVFGADIYSPRYPQINYRLDAKSVAKINDILAPFQGDRRKLYSGEIEKVDDLTGNKAFQAYVDSVKGKTTRYGDLQAEAKKMLEDVGAEERLFQGFTYSGNRRYAKHTLENVIKALKKDLRGGESFNYGLGSLRAKFTPQFRSIEQIRKAKGNLMEKASFEAVKKEADEELIGISNDLGLSLDQTIEVLEDAPKMGVTRAIERAMKDYKRTEADVDDDVKLRVGNFLTHLRNMPTEYFEGKMLRGVGINEFKAAVVPEGTKKEVLGILEKNGLRVFTYKEDDDADRTRAIRQAADETPDALFSRSEEGQLPAVINPSTVSSIQSAIAELLGGKQLPNSLGRIVAATAADIKSTWEPLIGKNVQIGSEGESGVAQAFYEPGTKTVFMIADHIAAGTETAVLAHELMHKHGQEVLGETGWNRLHSHIKTWKNAKPGSDERMVYDYASRKVEAVGEELSTQELFPYAVEAAIRMGIKPSMAASRGTVSYWLESVRQNLKMVWGKITGKPETFKAQDLVDLAFGIAQMEAPESSTELSGALTGEQSPELFDIRSKWEDKGLKLDIYEQRNGDLNLSRIVVPQDGRNAGLGTQAMQDIISYADKSNKRIVLSPSSDFGGNKTRLVEFYKKLGFVENKGQNKDLGISESMYRVPTESAPALSGEEQQVAYARGSAEPATGDTALARGAEESPELFEEPRQPGKPSHLIGRDQGGRAVFAQGQALYNLIGKAASPLLIKLQMKSASPELTRQLRAMKLDVQKAQDVAVAVAHESQKLSDAERLMVSDIIEKELKSGVIPPEHAIRLASVMNEAMHRQSDELVRLGMLSPETAKEWDGRYLPRFYESKLKKQVSEAWADAARLIGLRPKSMKGIKGQHLKGRGLYETVPESSLADYEAMGWKVRDHDYTPNLPSVDGTVQVWRDFTRQERESMGEIRDAGFRFVMGYMQTQRDIALGRMFEDMAENPESSSRLQRDGWVRVPDITVEGTGAKRYGKLAGRYVPAETLSQLTNIEEAQSAAWRMYRGAMAVWKMGKALALDTPLPTPTGWTTMGEVQVGDTVFDERGKPCTVTYATGIQLDRTCYEVEFSDGAKIVADEEHLWFTLYHGRDAGVRSTKQILDTLKERTRGDNKHSVPVADALELPPAQLPVDPYVLGSWLGDGATTSARLTCGAKDLPEVLEHLAAGGVVPGSILADKRSTAHTFQMRLHKVGCLRGHGPEHYHPNRGCKVCDTERQRSKRAGTTTPPAINGQLSRRLRDMGLFGNKHIPAAFLRASVAQRQALLQGLMDTDGHVTERGICEFTTTAAALRNGMMELVRSLGYKPVCAESRSTLNGRDCGPKWRITFTAYSDVPVFRLARKVVRLRPAPNTRQRSRTRKIVSIRSVPSVPVKCIEVDSESHLYLAGEAMIPTHNTALNPVSHTNNIVSNLTMAHFAGIGYHRADKYVGALRDFVESAPMVKEARDAGLFLGTMSDAELMNTMPAELKAMAVQADSKLKKGATFVFDAMTFWLRKPMGAAYQAEDTFFRYLIYRDARQRGVDPQDAVDYAQKYIFTYDDLPKGARYIRDFGIPFFAYTYKAVPALLNTALTRPDRFAAPAAVLWLANAAAYAIATGDDDDDWMESIKKYLTDSEYRAQVREKEKLERELLPPWMKGHTALFTPKAIRLGMDEMTKLPVFLDTSRIVPGGDIFDVNPNAGGIPLPQPITPSHPLFSIATAMIANKDLYFGKELVDANDTRAEAAAKRGAWIWKQVAPAIAVGNYHWERSMNAIAQASGGEVKWVPDFLGGDATGIGRDGNPVQPGYAAMQTFGIKARPIDLDTAEKIDQSQRKKMISDIDAEMRKLKRLNRMGAISDRTLDKAWDSADKKKDRIREGLTVDGDERK